MNRDEFTFFHRLRVRRAEVDRQKVDEQGGDAPLYIPDL